MAQKPISIEQSASQMVGNVNDNIEELATLNNVQQSELTEVSKEMSAESFVNALNGNFGALYEGAGSGQGSDEPSVDGQDTVVYYYDVIASSSYALRLGLKAGDKVTVYKHPRNGNNIWETRSWDDTAVWVANDPSSAQPRYTKDPDANITHEPILLKGNLNYTGSGAGTFGEHIGNWGQEHTLTNDYAYLRCKYRRFIIKVERTVSSQVMKTPLYGKRWLAIGDSITTERSGYSDKSYVSCVADALHMRAENVAVGGETVIYHYNKLNSEIREVWGDYDVITVMLGTNDIVWCPQKSEVRVNTEDYTGFTEMPTNSQALTINLPSRYQLLYDKLKSLWPNAMIVFISIIRRGETTSSYPNNPNAVVALKNVCAYYNLPCIDIYDSVDPWDETSRDRYILKSTLDVSDPTHPSRLAHERLIAPKVINGMLEASKVFYGHRYEIIDVPKIIVYNPNSTSEVSSLTITGSTAKILVKGINLTDNIKLTVSNNSFSIPETDALNNTTELLSNGWNELVISHDGEDTSATITFTSGTGVNAVTKTLNVTYSAS